MESVLLDDSNSEQSATAAAEMSDEICRSVCERQVYTVFSEKVADYIAYGICVTDEQGNLLKSVHDITCDAASLESLVVLCNRLELSLCHLDDVIEDFLG